MNKEGDMELRTFLLMGGILLTGCGGDDFSAGVSLGGTGNGSGIGVNNPQPPTTNPPIIGEPDETPIPELEEVDTSILKEQVYSGKKEQSCGGLHRSMYFKGLVNGQYDEIVEELRTPISQYDRTVGAILHVKVCNTTSSPVYEYIPSCRSPISLLNQNGTPILPHNWMSCINSEFIHVYQPNQCHTYDFRYTFANVIKQWKFRYQTEYAFNLIGNDNRIQCEPLETSLKIVAMDQEEEVTSPDIDQQPPLVGGGFPSNGGLVGVAPPP
ncbi:hypothetical protein F2A31_05540 [Acinetobacter suaedae]|uniref:Uncharacterized protein n=1 Tax=Acinetobacter suaedae TaxID=2609668 RepID=A0A5P1USV0_9GAMM|nr:hypothetical protein [Acinetobacter sp. C16S1]QER39193.1 hypothetical protein F2A31_05540 [Acinetobacter sp. C16S1]